MAENPLIKLAMRLHTGLYEDIKLEAGVQNLLRYYFREKTPMLVVLAAFHEVPAVMLNGPVCQQK